MALPTLGVKDKDNVDRTINTPNSGQQASADSAAVVLSIENVRQLNRMFAVAGDVTTRPANTTAYTAGDSISNNSTAGSVTATKVDISAANDLPVELHKITLDSADLGLATCQVAIHLFNSDPTASSGVGAGDNAAYTQKRAGYLGRFEGFFRAFSDGVHATLTPTEPGPLHIMPASGTARIWYQIQILSNSSTMVSASALTPTFRGKQGAA